MLPPRKKKQCLPAMNPISNHGTYDEPAVHPLNFPVNHVPLSLLVKDVNKSKGLQIVACHQTIPARGNNPSFQQNTISLLRHYKKPGSTEAEIFRFDLNLADFAHLYLEVLPHFAKNLKYSRKKTNKNVSKKVYNPIL